VTLRSLSWGFAATTLVLSLHAASAAPFRAQDYAFAATLDIHDPGPVYAATLPLEVYRSVTRADLSDVCIVNAAGELVPFALRRPEPARSEPADLVPLNLFPVQGTSEASGEALRLRLRAGETSLDIDRPAAATSTEHPTSYLVDARSLKTPITEVRIEWGSSAAPFSARLSIDASEDLEHWRPVSTGTELVSLHYAGQDFVRDTVSIAPTQASFLRLVWNDVAIAPVITQVGARPQGDEAPVQKLSYAVAGTPTDQEGEFEFDLGARIPAERVTLLLPERNSVANVEFLLPVPETRNWRGVVAGQVYDLGVPGSSDLVNPPLPVASPAEQRWRVRIGKAGGGIGHGVPRLEVSWTPSEVLFLARGNGPYQLLYGNAAATALSLDPGALLNPIGTSDPARRRFVPNPATLEATHVLGGVQRLRPVTPTPDWKRWILWAVLVMGVAALGSMAWKLSKSMSKA
jgi:hypothetical protein